MDSELVRIFALFKELGSLRAKQNWHECFDPKHETPRSKTLKFQIVSLNKKINIIKSSLSAILDDQNFENLVSECTKFMESEQETIEQSIEKEHRPSGAFFDKKFFGEIECPSGVFFNKNALVVLTKTEIPEDIQLGLSFGYKFLFPYVCDDSNLLELLAQLELTILNAIPDLRQLEVSTEIFHILKNRDSLQYDNNKRWLSFVNKRTVNFLDKNKDIFATKSDKGGHTVIMDISDYETRLEALLSDENYSKINTDPLPQLIEKEKELVSYILKLEPVKEMGLHKGVPAFEPDTLQLPKFYGLPKIHKTGFPLRPITPTCNATGFYLAKLFNKMLNMVFPRSEHHIRDTEQFVDFINNLIISANDVLVSFDVVSMFTNIVYELVYDIVMEKWQDFYRLFSIDPLHLRQILEFLLQKCTVFTALGNTYKQKDGLPMGSCISPTLARIVMDVIVNKLLATIPSISFIKVFVDDTIAAIDRSLVEKALETLNNFKAGIKFTLERENESFSINFLNVTLTRDRLDDREDSPRTVVSTNWYRKHFASGRLLNYYSSHKRTTVLGTATNFIKTVLYLSDGRYFHENRQKVIDSLRENSFPESIISVLMNNYYTYMRPKHCKPGKLTEKPSKKPNDSIPSQIKADDEMDKNPYEMFPHSICKGRSIKSVLLKHLIPGKILADSVRNTKVNSVTTRKTITPLEKRKKLILISECICKKKIRVIPTGFNETGEISSRKVLNRKMTCDAHGHAFKKVKFQRGLYYSSQTNRLANFLQWKHRKKLDSSLPFEFPMNHLRKLLK